MRGFLCWGKVLEIRPVIDWHKGRIIEWFVTRCGGDGSCDRVVLYAGDDLTDEDAFKTVRSMKGISVRVGHENPAFCAEYRTTTQAEVVGLLKKLVEIQR